MNFGAPAQCNGTVTSWQYCSYNRYLEEDDERDDSDDSDSRDDGDDGENYTSIFLVYRQTGTSTYELVPGSTMPVTISLRHSRDGGFQCHQATLSQSEQFNIQENDIVAACLMDTGSTNPISTVGVENSGSSGQVYQYNAKNYQWCTASQLQMIDTQNSAFTLLPEYRLHLYAEITSKCMWYM